MQDYVSLDGRKQRSYLPAIQSYVRASAAKRSRCLVGIVLAFWLLSVYVFHTSHRNASPPSAPQDRTYGDLNSTSSTSRYAIATFLTEDTYDEAEDGYFLAARILTYQLLHAEETAIAEENRGRIDWIVMVTEAVSETSREHLRRDGAMVVQVDSVPLSWWIGTGITRWKDQFTKLRLLQWVQYERVLFVDADTILTGRLDTIFDEEEDSKRPTDVITEKRRKDESPYPAQYVFMARPDNAMMGEREHEVPPPRGDAATESISAGFWLAAPSPELYDYMVGVMSHWRRFDSTTMEQALFNYVFRRDGPMPWKEMDWKWSATWPSQRDRDAGVKSLHEKLWRTGPDELKELWLETRRKMESFWDGDAGIFEGDDEALHLAHA